MNWKQALGQSMSCDVKTCPAVNVKAATCTNRGCVLYISRGAK
jgi:hypothetical protein